MHNASIPFLPYSFHQPSHLAGAQPRHTGRFLLAQLLLQNLMDQVESLDLMRSLP